MNESEKERVRASARQMVGKYLKRQIHHKLTLKVIKSTPDDKLEQVILDYIHTKFPSEESEFSIVSNLSFGFQMVYSTWLLESEVNNGGFNQFFHNPSGKFAEMALQSLKLLGATDYYSVLQEAIDINKSEQSNSKLQDLYSQKTSPAFSDSYQITKLNDCDKKFFNLGERLSKIRSHYIRLNPENFISK